jgi:thiamine biosynthesis lipoprotein
MNPDPRIPGRLTRRRFALALPLLGALAYLAPGRALASAPGGLVRESRVLMGTGPMPTRPSARRSRKWSASKRS